MGVGSHLSQTTKSKKVTFYLSRSVEEL